MPINFVQVRPLSVAPVTNEGGATPLDYWTAFTRVANDKYARFVKLIPTYLPSASKMFRRLEVQCIIFLKLHGRVSYFLLINFLLCILTSSNYAHKHYADYNSFI